MFNFKQMDNHRIFGKLINQHSKNESLYLSNSLLINKHVTSWKFNRPCDESRIEEIKNDITSHGIVEGIIYVAEILGDNKELQYVCYDGNHRREATSRLNESYNMYIQVMWDATHDLIKDKFIRLNTANPVPELYINNDENDEHKRVKVLNVVQMISKKFPKHQTASNKPQKPNFNRDKLTEYIWNNLNINNMNDEEVFNRLLQLNEKYSHYKFNINEKIINKCKKNNCYLFVNDFSNDFNNFVV